nr:Unknown Function [uncultured bacterium]
MSPEGNIQTGEQSPVPDNHEIKERAEVILGFSGESWTGKTRIAEAVGRRLGITPENGQEYFNRRTGMETGAIDRLPKVDLEFDHWQKNLLKKAIRGTGKILETRMLGINLAEERDHRDDLIAKRNNDNKWRMQKGKTPRPELPPIPAISILITSNKETRVERAYKAAMSAGEPTSKTAIRASMEERKDVDMENWSVVHPYYLGNGEDPFDPTLKRPDGTPVWDIVVPNPDVPGISEEEAIEKCADYIMGELRKFGVVVPENDSDNQNALLNRTIFLDPEADRIRQELGIDHPKIFSDLDELEDKIKDSQDETRNGRSLEGSMDHTA